MTELEAIEAIYGHFEDGWEVLHPADVGDPDHVPYTFRGETFTPDTLGALGAWARVNVIHTSATQMTQGNAAIRRWERRGNIYVQLFGPRGFGVALLAELADDARTVFEGFRVGGVNLYEGRTEEGGEDPAWAVSTVVIPFRYTETR